MTVLVGNVGASLAKGSPKENVELCLSALSSMIASGDVVRFFRMPWPEEGPK